MLANPNELVKIRGEKFNEFEVEKGETYNIEVELFKDKTVRITMINVKDYSQYKLSSIPDEGYVFDLFTRAFEKKNEVKIIEFKCDVDSRKITLDISYPLGFGSNRTHKMFELMKFEIDDFERLEMKCNYLQDEVKEMKLLLQNQQKRMEEAERFDERVKVLDLKPLLDTSGIWKSISKDRLPIARKKGNIVQFSGCIDRSKGGSHILSGLPPEFRPLVQQIFPVIVNDQHGSSNGVLRFRVEANGSVTIEGIQKKNVTRIFLAPVMYMVE